MNATVRAVPLVLSEERMAALMQVIKWGRIELQYADSRTRAIFGQPPILCPRCDGERCPQTSMCPPRRGSALPLNRLWHRRSI